MINFFRKTRKKMADDNKPLKYMRYAIGEILLVVIGILIALSINNWNEIRKEKIQEEHILETLLKDLYLAENESKEMIKKEEIIFKTLEHFLSGEKQRNELIMHPKIDSIFGLLIWGSVGTNVPVINSYTDLKNASKTNLISNELIRSYFTILENQFFKLKKMVQDRLSVQITNIDGYAMNNLNFIPLMKLNERNFKVDYGEPNDYNELFKDRFIINSIATKLELTASVLTDRESLLREIDALIMLIERELNPEL